VTRWVAGSAPAIKPLQVAAQSEQAVVYKAHAETVQWLLSKLGNGINASKIKKISYEYY